MYTVYNLAYWPCPLCSLVTLIMHGLEIIRPVHGLVALVATYHTHCNGMRTVRSSQSDYTAAHRLV